MTRRILLLRLDPPLPAPPVNSAWVPIALSSDRVAFHIPGAGVPESAPFLACISASDDVVIERHVSVWPFDRSATRRFGSLTLLNGDGALNHLLARGGRDWRYELRWCTPEQAADPGTRIDLLPVWQGGLVESLSASEDDRYIQLVLADPLAALDRPLQRDLYPDNHPNETIRGKPRPISLGRVRYVPGIARNHASTGPEAFAYEFGDRPIYAIDAVFDRGDAFATSDWHPSADRCGLRLVNKPDGPVCAHLTVHTDIARSDLPRHGWHFAFDPWPGGRPQGWRTTGPAFTLQRRANRGALIRTLGQTGAALETLLPVMESGALYRLEIEVVDYVSGSLWAEVNGQRVFGDMRHAITGPGRWVLQGTASGSDLRLRLNLPPASYMTVSQVRLVPVMRGDTLSGFMREIIRRVNPLLPVDWASVDRLNQFTNIDLGLHAASPVTALSVLRQALDGYCGWLGANRKGELVVGRLTPRQGRTGAIKLGREHIISVRRSADTAPGLSQRLAGRRNHCVHADSDLATSVPAALRADLKTEYTIATAGTAMPAAYAHAVAAEARPTLIQSPAPLAAAANHVGQIFQYGALAWYEVECALSDAMADQLEPGDWIHLTHPMEGLRTGRWLCLMGAVIRFNSRRATLTLLQLPEN